MNDHAWPDSLQPADPRTVAQLLEQFWRTLAQLPDLVERQGASAGADVTALLRQHRAAHDAGAQRHRLAGRHGASQHLSQRQPARAAIEKTLLAPGAGAESWIGQAVALVVIYRWYAPQLAEAL